MAFKMGWSAYLNGEFVPDSEDEDFFDSLPPLPPPPPGYVYESSGGFQCFEESFGGAVEKGLTAVEFGKPTAPSPVRRPINRRPSTAMKVEESDLLPFLCNEKWDDVVRERDEAADGDLWAGYTPAVRAMLEIMFPPIKG